MAELMDAYTELDGKLPDQAELDRLVHYYPKYKQEHRQQLLHGYFHHKSVDQIFDSKLDAKNIPTPLKKGGKGGHYRWIYYKVKYVIIKLKYLRYRLDQNLTKRQANNLILKHYGPASDKKTKDGGQSGISKITKSAVLDKEQKVKSK